MSSKQTCSSQVWWTTNKLIAADKGRFIAPTRRSVMARLNNRVVQGYCSSLLCVTTMMTEMFKITVAGEAMQVMPSKIQENVVPLRSHSKLGAYGQEKNIKLISVARIVVVSVSFKTMLTDVELLPKCIRESWCVLIHEELALITDKLSKLLCFRQRVLPLIAS